MRPDRNGLWRALVALWASLAVACPALAADEAGRFDYYVMALSWSPTYCETDGSGRNEPQCTGERPYAFVLHGLWPQYRRGWPEHCATAGRPWVPESVIGSMLDIMPSRGLVIHQYRKHGTCSGLAPGAYFAAARRAYESVRIPARYLAPTRPVVVSPRQVETDFLKTNPHLDADAIAVSCRGGRRLREVRICLTRGLRPMPCGPNEAQRRLCSLDRVVLPPVRQRPAQ